MTFVLAGHASTIACGLIGASLFDADLDDALSFLGAQRPVLPHQAANPDAVVVERSDAMVDERAQCRLVDLLAAGPAEGCVEGVDHSSEGAGGPLTRFLLLVPRWYLLPRTIFRRAYDILFPWSWDCARALSDRCRPLVCGGKRVLIVSFLPRWNSCMTRAVSIPTAQEVVEGSRTSAKYVAPRLRERCGGEADPVPRIRAYIDGCYELTENAGPETQADLTTRVPGCRDQPRDADDFPW